MDFVKLSNGLDMNYVQQINTSQRHKYSHKSAFTLVEILVTVAILAVLSTMALAWTSQSIRKANMMQGVSNLRNIGVAIHAYAGDNYGMFPESWSDAPSGQQTWVHKTVPYMRSGAKNDKTVWVCPNAPLPPMQANDGDWITTYAIHGRLGRAEGDPSDANFEPRMRMARVENASEVIMVADAVQRPENLNLPDNNLWRPGILWSDVDQAIADDPIDYNDDDNIGGISFQQPGDQCNALMVDGSVQPLKKGEVFNRNFATKFR